MRRAEDQQNIKTHSTFGAESPFLVQWGLLVQSLSSTFCQLAIEAPSPPGLDQSAWPGYAAASVINRWCFLCIATRHVAGCVALPVRHPCTTARHGQTHRLVT